MRQRSSDKVKQVLELMKVLHVRCEARERIDRDGFIEKMVYWIDDEKYPMPPPVVEPVKEEKPAETQPEVDPAIHD